MKLKNARDISASFMQVAVNQLSGVLIFFILSAYFSKSTFGQINWAMAVLMTTFAILGCGIDQLAVKKIAAGDNAAALVKTYLFHVLAAGILFVAILWIGVFFYSGFFFKINVLLFLAIGQLMGFIALPFKQVANGKERFGILLAMCTGANIIKLTALLIMALLGTISLTAFLLIYLVASAIELIICIFLGRYQLQLPIKVSGNGQQYKALLRESLPQLGVVICSAGIARIDWILLGVLSTPVVLAEYSFAYKAFELSTLPLLMIAPLLLPKIAKWFSGIQLQLPWQKKETLFSVARLEIMLACLVALMLNIVWAPLVDAVTGSRYGAVNSNTIFILSCSLPFLYLNNILWSVNFSQGRLKLTLVIFIITFVITTIGDLTLIPLLHAEGAAIAYLMAIVIQSLHFILYTQIKNIHRVIYFLLLCTCCAFVSGLLIRHFVDNTGLQGAAAAGFYFITMYVSGLIKASDWFTIKKIAWA